MIEYCHLLSSSVGDIDTLLPPPYSPQAVCATVTYVTTDGVPTEMSINDVNPISTATLLAPTAPPVAHI